MLKLQSYIQPRTWCKTKRLFEEAHELGSQQAVHCMFVRNLKKLKQLSRVKGCLLPEDKELVTCVYGWGFTMSGALGYFPHFKNKKFPPKFLDRPVLLRMQELTSVTDIACGYGFTVFAVDDPVDPVKKLFGTGINTEMQLGFQPEGQDCIQNKKFLSNPKPILLPLKDPRRTKVTQVSAGRAHTLVLTDNEGVFTFGSNCHGQCAREMKEPFCPPIDFVQNIRDLGSRKIKSVTCGQEHSIFINDCGVVYACGCGCSGQTGQGHFKDICEPSKVVGDICGEEIVKVSGTADTVLALSKSGEVFGWGSSEYDQFFMAPKMQALTTATHIPLKGVGKIVDISAGGSSCLVCNEAGDVFVWGYGLLGVGSPNTFAQKPTKIPPVLFGKNELQPDVKVVGVNAGIGFQMARTNIGDLFMWGKNKQGVLGMGDQLDKLFPVKVSIGSHVTSMCCGVDHAVAVGKPYNFS